MNVKEIAAMANAMQEDADRAGMGRTMMAPPDLTNTTIERIVPMPKTVYVSFLACGHIGHFSSNRSEVGEIGDRRRCWTCAQEDKR